MSLANVAIEDQIIATAAEFPFRTVSSRRSLNKIPAGTNEGLPEKTEFLALL
jgi:hypothetical protein